METARSCVNLAIFSDFSRLLKRVQKLLKNIFSCFHIFSKGVKHLDKKPMKKNRPNCTQMTEFIETFIALMQKSRLGLKRQNSQMPKVYAIYPFIYDNINLFVQRNTSKLL